MLASFLVPAASSVAWAGVAGAVGPDRCRREHR